MSIDNDIQLLTFCRNIRYLRSHHCLSKTKMARILGVGLKTLSSLEQNIIPPRLSTDVIWRASEYFRLAPHLFFLPLEE